MIEKMADNPRPAKGQGDPTPAKFKSDSFFVSSLRRLIRHKLAVIGMIILSVFLVLTIFADQFRTHSITSQNLRNRFAPPTRALVVPTDILIEGNQRVTAFSSGDVYARDAQMNLPRWNQQIDEPVLKTAASSETAYALLESGDIKAFALAQGGEVWRASVEGAQWIGAHETGLFVVKDDGQVGFLDENGEMMYVHSLPTAVAPPSEPKLVQPIFVTVDGQVYRVDESGASLLAELPTAEIARVAVTEASVYAVGAEGLVSMALDDGALTAHPGFVEPDETTAFLTKFQDTLLIGFDSRSYARYSLADESILWTAELEDEIVNLGHDGIRNVQIATAAGRILQINPATGGITSSRMLEGYKDVNIMGTDELGRDVFSRLLAGGRVSISLGFLVSIVSVVLGSIVGAVAGYYGGVMDTVVMRFVDFMLAIPSLPLLMLISFILGPSFQTMTIVLVIFGWMTISRVVRSQTLSLKQQDFFVAAKAIGVSTPGIIFRHLLPNVIGPVIVAATLQVGTAILSESQLSYLGLGIQPPTPSWGNMLMNARSYLTTSPWLALWPGLCIFLVLLAINFIGDGLRDALDPKLKGR